MPQTPDYSRLTLPARERVRREFRREVVWEAWERAIRETVEMVGAAGGSGGRGR